MQIGNYLTLVMNEGGTMDTLISNHSVREQDNGHYRESNWVSEAEAHVTEAPVARLAVSHFLDNQFPLAQGSHQHAASYHVYYHQLLIFMKDGTQVGLRFPKQFVAFKGHRNEPSAVLLKANGVHVELVLDKQRQHDASDCDNIEDILVKGDQYWISVMNVQQTAKMTQRFTAKNGSDYTFD